MTHYLELRVGPDPEFPVNILLGALVSKLHLALVQFGANDLGISFPQHEEHPPLGHMLRLHGTDIRLAELMETDWLRGMRDNLEIGEVAPVPSGVVHRVVRRKQYKTNADRLRRRRMKRHGESYEEASQHIPDTVERKIKTPFVVIRSLSSGQTFSLFIEHGACQPTAVPGRYNTYGLSKTATVPWF